MQLWVGLGNPGPTYALHRHNIGFMAIDAIAATHGLPAPSSRFQGWFQDGRVGTARVLALKPATFMNEAGRSVAEAVRFYKLDVGAITVFHDELDLDPFRIKVRTGGGAAGHNGIRSMIAHLGDGFRRVRIGIGHPGHKDRVTPHVLGNFARAEMDRLSDCLGAIAAEAPTLAQGDDVRFASDYARRMAD